MKLSFEYQGLRDLQGRFQRIAGEEARNAESDVRAATELVYQQAKANIARMFRNPGRMQNALRMTFNRVSGGTRGSVEIEGVGYVTQEFGGTRPYVIFPGAGKKVLAFEGSAPFGSAGQTVFTPYVLHPPLPERSYLRLALEQKQAEIRELFADRVRARFKR